MIRVDAVCKLMLSPISQHSVCPVNILLGSLSGSSEHERLVSFGDEITEQTHGLNVVRPSLSTDDLIMRGNRNLLRGIRGLACFRLCSSRRTRFGIAGCSNLLRRMFVMASTDSTV